MKNNQNDKQNIKNHTYDSEADEEVGNLSIDQNLYGDLYLGLGKLNLQT